MNIRYLIVLMGLFAPLAYSADFSGNVATELVIFPNEAASDQQLDENLTFSLKPKWEGEWNDGDDLWSIELFLRADDKDEERNHADIRELMWLHIDGDSEWRVGINTMFWGVTENKHLVDAVNQIDNVEGVDGEDKLGQPMLHWKRYEDWGVIDLLVLPGFRERNFQSTEGRLRTPLIVDADAAEYESSAEETHIDYALRYSHTLGDLDLGLSLFHGTNRDPQFRVEDGFIPVLIPFYEQITQLGVDALLIHEDWLWKLEFIHRNREAKNHLNLFRSSTDYEAYTGGFEYTFYGINGSDIDLGSIVEYSYEDLPEEERGVFGRDVFIGGRFAFNDAESSEILAGLFYDTNNQSQSFRIEGSRRFGESLKGTLELQTFSNIDDEDPLQAFKQDDFVLVELAWYF